MMNYVLLILALFSSFVASEEQNTTYKLGAGDEISIVVYDEPDLTIEMSINNNGRINFPLIGSLAVKGKTADELQLIIHDKLQGDYLKNPSVQVDIVTYRPFYIQGEVEKPGAYPYEPELNVDRAIALAGGLTERASKNKIFIKQKTSKNEGKKVKLNQTVNPGDVINVEQSFF